MASEFSSGLLGGMQVGQMMTDSDLAQQQFGMQQKEFRASQRAIRLQNTLFRDEVKRKKALETLQAGKYALMMQKDNPQAWATMQSTSPALAKRLKDSIKESMNLGLTANATDERERTFEGFDPVPGPDGNPDPEKVAVRMRIKEPDGTVRQAHMSERGSSDPDDPIVGIGFDEILKDADSLESMIAAMDTQAVALGDTGPIEDYEAGQEAEAERMAAEQEWRRDRMGNREDARMQFGFDSAMAAQDQGYNRENKELDWRRDRQDAQFQFGMDKKLAGYEASLEGDDPYTLSPGELRMGGNNQVVARGMKEQEDPESMFGKIDPSDFTPESLRTFSQTRDMGSLQPIQSGPEFGSITPADYTHRSIAEYERTGMVSALRPRQEGGDDLFSTVNPKDYEPASLAAYRRTQDPSVLVPREEPETDSPYGQITPSDYTPESLREFGQSNSYADLVPRSGSEEGAFSKVDPSKYTPQSINKFNKSANYADLALRKPAAEPASATTIGGMRKEFTGQSKDFTTVKNSYTDLQNAASDPSAAGDLTMIYGLMKMLDPGAVVREQDFANAQNAAGVPDRIRNIWNKALTGERLASGQREDFVNQAKSLFDSRLQSHLSLEQQYRGLAKRNQIRPNDVVIDYVGQYRNPGEVGIGMPRMVEPSGMSTSGRMAPAGNMDEQVSAPIIVNPSTGEKMTLRNGKWAPL